MKIVCISDTHLSEPELPEGDILIHAGDALCNGALMEWNQFVGYLGKVAPQFKKVIYVPGNHDWWAFDFQELAKEELSSLRVRLLVDEQFDCMIDGVHVMIYGTPWVPFINGQWAFESPDNDFEFLRRKFEHIGFESTSEVSEAIKILVSHAPPYQILDKGRVHYGSTELLERVRQVQPALHVFGHIHEAHGVSELSGTKFVNAAIMDETYKPTNPPIVIEL